MNSSVDTGDNAWKSNSLQTGLVMYLPRPYMTYTDTRLMTFKSFLDLISESLVGSDLLMDIVYKVVGVVNDDMILLQVSGDVSSILEDYEEGLET